MIKQVFTYSLIALLLLNGMAYSLIRLDYELNKEFISSTLCINRDKPSLNCNGKCVLGQKIAKAQEQKKQAQQTALESVPKSIYFKSHTSFSWRIQDTPFVKHQAILKEIVKLLLTADFFQPPI